MKAIIGRKIGMTRVFDENGKAVPVTLIEAKPNIVTQVKQKEKDGYEALQIAWPEEKRIGKAQGGHLAKTKVKSRILKEFRFTGKKVAEKVDLAQFQVGDQINVSAISKGKGFAGTVKRHHFHLGPKTHGSDNYRQPGSIGSMYPQRVIKGRRMGGHLGHQKVTVQNLKVVSLDLEKNILLVKGAVPGPNKSIVCIWSNNDQD